MVKIFLSKMIRVTSLFGVALLSSCLLLETESNTKYPTESVAYELDDHAVFQSDKKEMFLRLKTDSVLIDGAMSDSMYYRGSYVDSVEVGNFKIVGLPEPGAMARLDSAHSAVSQCESWQYTNGQQARLLKVIDTLRGFYDTVAIGQVYDLYYHDAIDSISAAENFCKNREGILAETYNLLLNEYLYDQDLQPYTTYSNVESLFDGLSDRFTSYRKPTPNPTQQQTQWLAPVTQGKLGLKYKNIGSSVKQTDSLEITEVYPMSPAEDAGLQKGDRILSVDSVIVYGTGENSTLFNEVTKGEAGKTILFEIKRKGTVFFTSATKDNIRVPTVWVDSIMTGWSNIIKAIGVIEIDRFSTVTYDPNANGTKSEFKIALEKTAHFEHTIIDFRSNGGGVVSQCTDMADELVAGGILYRRNSMYEGKKYSSAVEATLGGLGENREFTFLVNGGSASCTEIFLIAIRENRGDIIIGDTTYGKGIGQGIHQINKGLGGSAKVTSSEYIGKLGTVYHLKGIVPDILIEKDQDAKEVAMELLAGSSTIAQKRSIVPSVQVSEPDDTPVEEPYLIDDMLQPR
ncbi:MAG: S41 family peptidase [Fibrobacterales bacterium]